MLVLAALSARAEVLHEPLCEKLPEVSPEVKEWVARIAPELAQVSVRELPEQTAVDVFHRAASAGWGGIDVLTHDVFREPCTFHFPREALRAVGAAFDLDLVPPLQGHDTAGQGFEMAGILAGRGRLVVLYDRDGIVYRSEDHGREFELASRVEFDTPVAGALGRIQGLCVKVFLFGCVRVRTMVKDGEMITVSAGTFTSRSRVKPIRPRAHGRAWRTPGGAAPPGRAVGAHGRGLLRLDGARHALRGAPVALVAEDLEHPTCAGPRRAGG